MKQLIIISIASILVSCQAQKNEQDKINPQSDVEYDSHVHLMSPGLVKYWKGIGIPFSKSESNYSDIDTIVENNKSKYINLIGMGYVYGNPEYYQGEDSYQRMLDENDYLLKTAKSYPEKIIPFFAIDPLKDYAINELERCYQINSKSGLKLHFNASQVYLTEPEHLDKVKQVFKKSAEYKLPILLHFDNWHPKFGELDIELLVDSILNEIKPIQLQIAHFGTSGGFNEKTKRFIDAFVALRNQNRIPSKHKILFDISAVALDKDSEGVSKLSEEEFMELKKYINKIGIDNIVFGTDYPLYKSDEYFNILKEKVGLTEQELRQITKKNTATNNG